MSEARRSILAYVGGPYRDPRGPWFIQANIRAAEAVALELWRMGVPTICPHKNTALFDGAADDAVWLRGDLEMLRRCDVLVLVPTWKTSRGTQAEVQFAQAHDIPVFVWEQPNEALRYWVACREGQP